MTKLERLQRCLSIYLKPLLARWEKNRNDRFGLLASAILVLSVGASEEALVKANYYLRLFYGTLKREE